jgi:hypothetical protein
MGRNWIIAICLAFFTFLNTRAQNPDPAIENLG